jgi:hypothetical protein
MGRRGVALAALIAVALAGCGGDDSSGDTPLQRQPTVAAQIPADLTLTPKDAKRIVQAGALRAEDFPPGWTSKPNDDDEDDDLDCRVLAHQQFEEPVGDLDAPEFDHDAEAVFNSIGVWPNRDGAKRTMDVLDGTNVGDCMIELFRKESRRDFRVGNVTAEPLHLTSIGDEAAGFGMDVPIQTQGKQVTMFIDIESVRVGNAITITGYMSVFAPPSASLRDALVKASVDRLTAAQIES